MNVSSTPQNTEQWMAERHGVATASEFKKIITAKTGAVSSQAIGKMGDMLAECECACLESWGKWSGLPCDCEHLQTWGGNTHTDRGHALEDEALAALGKVLGTRISKVGLVTQDNRVLGCSPDGLVGEPNNWGFGAEVKCPTLSTYNGRVWANELPAEYVQQVHGSLAVTGLPEWHFACYYPGKRLFHKVIKPDSYTRKVEKALIEFVRDYQAYRKYVIPNSRLEEEEELA